MKTIFENLKHFCVHINLLISFGGASTFPTDKIGVTVSNRHWFSDVAKCDLILDEIAGLNFN